MRIILGLLTLFMFHFSWAQNLEEYSEINVIPPSPNVAAFQKFVDIPVSLYTGTPDITIPVYEIKTKQLSLPIVLKYHASALKVEEYASWVGAGWILSAGGSISRTVKGLPDELNEISTGKKGMFYNTRLFNANGTIDLLEVQDCNGAGSTLVSSDPLTTADSVAQGILDLEPDLYHFNFPSGSGKFSFTFNCKTGPCELIKYTDDDVRIIEHPFDGTESFPTTAGSYPDYKWVIEGPDGTIYTFEDAERTEAVGICGASISPYSPSFDYYQSSWHLTKIENSGDSILFEYSPEQQQYDQKYSESAQFKISGNGPQSTSSGCYNDTRVTAQRLVRIHTSEGYEINFEADTNDRLDLTGSKKLDFIKITKSEYPIKFFELNYSYFGSGDKLKLDAVIPKSGPTPSSESLNGYLFDYYGGGIFPSTDSNSQDYWGFYNGQANLYSMIPPYKNDNYHVNQSSTTSRAPDLGSARLGALRKIIYPTGGWTRLDYGLNEYYGEDHKRTYIEQAVANDTEDVTKNFYVPADCSATLTKESGQSPDSYVELRKWDGDSYETVTLPLVPIGNRQVLDSGSYQLFAHQVGSGSASIKIEYEQVEDIDIQIGGLRVEQITFKDPVENTAIVKKYEYVDSLGHSSGVLFTPASLGGHISTREEGETTMVSCTTTDVSQYINLSAYTQIPLAIYQGSHVGYSVVTEYVSKEISGSKDLGFTVHVFENDKDQAPANFPYVAQKDYSFKNGNKVKETVYENNSGTYKKVKSTANEYGESVLTGTIRGMNFKSHKTTFCYECDASNFSYNEYFVKPTWYNLVKTIETEYDQNETPVLKKVYEYDYPAVTSHNLPISKTFYSSKKDTLQEQYIRDSNHPALVTEFKKLKQSNNLTNEVVDGRKVTYNGKVPTEFYTWDRQNEVWVWRREMNYAGNVLQEVVTSPDLASMGGSSKTSYIFGYNKSYPVVECNNLDYTSLSTAVAAAINAISGYSGGLADLDNLLDDVHDNGYANWDTFNDNLRSQLASLNVTFTTYTFKPGVGISSITDSNGVSQFYVYDDFNRLKYIEDTDGNAVKEFKYHYMSQN